MNESANKHNLQLTIDLMKDEDRWVTELDFNMANWLLDVQGEHSSVCGTVCCIGGTAQLAIYGRPSKDIPEEVIGAALGLTKDQSNALFYPSDVYDIEEYIQSTPEGQHHMGIDRAFAIKLLEGIRDGTAVIRKKSGAVGGKLSRDAWTLP